MHGREGQIAEKEKFGHTEYHGAAILIKVTTCLLNAFAASGTALARKFAGLTTISLSVVMIALPDHGAG
jgi:hypothetical protein